MQVISCGIFSDLPCYIENGEVTETFDSLNQEYWVDWMFYENGSLKLSIPIAYQNECNERDHRCIAFGISLFGFGDSGKLTVNFLKHSKICCSSEIVLGFCGWRTVWLGLDKDCSGIPEFGMDAVEFVSKLPGRVIVSSIVPGALMEPRNVMASYQTPFIQEWNHVLLPFDVETDSATDEMDKQAYKTILERMQNNILRLFAPVALEKENLLEEYEEFKIQPHEIGMVGKKIASPIQLSILSTTAYGKTNWVNLSQATQLLFRLACSWHFSRDGEIADAFFCFLDYLILQGVDEGSTLGSHAILDYHVKAFYQAQIIMMEEIHKRGYEEKLHRIDAWFSHAGQLLFSKASEVPVTADDWNNEASGLCAAALCLTDKKKQFIWFQAISSWIEQSTRYTPGLMGLLKKDGCIYHHCGHYPVYGMTGMRGLILLIVALEGTAFSILNNAKQRMATAYMVLFFQSRNRNLPIVFSARHPLGTQQVITEAYELLREIMPELPTIDDADAVTGNRCFPYACAMVHKKKDWLVVAKGFSRYLWGSEIYTQNNLFGRYRSYGTIEILMGNNMKESGFSHDGYDWNYFPGATNIVLPFSELKGKVYNVDVESGFEEMLLSDEKIAGGVSDGEKGMFSMKLHEHPKYNGSHRAVKSVVFYNEYVVAMGSGISNASEYETVTTLFQNCLENQQTCSLNGDSVRELKNYEIKKNDVLQDRRDIFYHIQEGMVINLQSGIQESRSSENGERTQECFEKAYIKHGISPKNSAYLYVMGIKTSKPLAYRCVENTEFVHILEVENTTFIAVFVPEKFKGYEMLYFVSHPVFVMLEKCNDGIRCIVANPDLALYENDDTQYDEHHLQKEVGLYSRKWRNHPAMSTNIIMDINHKKIDLLIEGGQQTEFWIK